MSSESQAEWLYSLQAVAVCVAAIAFVLSILFFYLLRLLSKFLATKKEDKDVDEAYLAHLEGEVITLAVLGGLTIVSSATLGCIALGIQLLKD